MKTKKRVETWLLSRAMAGLTVILSLIMIARVTAGDELSFSTTEPAPELKWQPTSDVLKKAYVLSLRGTNAAEAIKDIRQAIQMSDAYINAHPGDKEGIVDANVIKAYGYFNIGEFLTDDAQCLKAYQSGRDAAQKVIDLAPDRWDGWAWYANNLGRVSQLKGVLKSLFLLPDFKKHIFQAEKLAPNSAFVTDAIGDMYRQLPWIAGGSMSKSKKYLEQCVKDDPNYTLGKLDLGITLLEDGDKAQAKQLFTEVVNAKSPSWSAHWLIWERPKAQALLNNMDNYKKLLDKWHMLV